MPENRPHRLGSPLVKKQLRPDVVVLAGGGIDSSVLMAMRRDEGEHTIAVHYDYGQGPAAAELQAVRYMGRLVGIRTTSRRLPVKLVQRKDEYMGRNALFVLAAAAEFSAQPIRIWLGAHAGSSHWDCTQGFTQSMQRVLDGYHDGTVTLQAPLQDMMKAEVVAVAHRMKLPLSRTFSCLQGPRRPCGECASCLDRKVLRV